MRQVELPRAALPFVAAAMSLTFLMATAASAAPTFKIVHNFTGGADGGAPGYTLATDRKGHFLGTASAGGNGNGVVFRLHKAKSGSQVKALYDFSDSDGAPGWGLTLAEGSLYTNASYAEVMDGPCGSALQLNPSGSGWSEVLMHTYVKKDDGCPTGNLALDSVGNLYGVTQDGGANGWGSIFELTKSGSNWNETILYSFTGGADGGAPYAGMIFDSAGNLYGTATASTTNHGTVFELSPSQAGWTYKVLYTFQGGNDGGQPVAGLILVNGNLYGAAESFGKNGGGTVFELSSAKSGWSFHVLASMQGTGGPVASLAMDTSGTLYGTNFFDGASGYGSVFKLTPNKGKWTYTDLHDFTGGSDGGYPGGGVAFDSKGNAFGTAVLGGTDNFGVLYEVTK